MWISWNSSTNLTDSCHHRHSYSHQFVFLVLRPNRCELTWWHQCISVEWGMILLLARKIGTHRFNMMTVNKVSLNRPEVFLSFRVIFCFFRSKFFPIAVRLSAEILSLLSLQRIPVSEWVLGSRSLFLMRLLNHRPQEIQILVFGVIRTSFASTLLGHISDASNFFEFFNLSSKNIYFPKFSPRTKYVLEGFTKSSFITEFSRLAGDLGHVADSNSIP